MGLVCLSVWVPLAPFVCLGLRPPSLPLRVDTYTYRTQGLAAAAVTVTNLSFAKKKKRMTERNGSRVLGGGSLAPLAQFYSGGAQPENSILRQQWRGKYLSKDQLWQSETH